MTQQVVQNKIIINVAMFCYMLIQLFIIYVKVSASFVIKSFINDLLLVHIMYLQQKQFFSHLPKNYF